MDLASTGDHLLTSTRSVRKRLDFSRPCRAAVIEKCLEIALQAPTGSNSQGWHFVVVTDAAKRKALADLYRTGWSLHADAASRDAGGRSAHRAAAARRR
ncbi:MAG: nitroreductase family protein [Burkholderiaceae bacterium]